MGSNYVGSGAVCARELASPIDVPHHPATLARRGRTVKEVRGLLKEVGYGAQNTEPGEQTDADAARKRGFAD